MGVIECRRAIIAAQDQFIPPEYQKYDWLRTTGSNSRINTGVTGNDTTLEIECTFMFTQISNSYVGVFGNYKDENNSFCWRIILPNVSTYPDPKFLYVTMGNGAPGGGNGLGGTIGMYPCLDSGGNTAPILNQKIYAYVSYGYCRMISSTRNYYNTASNKAASTNANNICIGALSTGTTGGTTQCKLYDFRFRSQNRLIRNYIPVVRKSDNKPGFYDTVNCTFNPSIGSAEFVAGND